MASISTGTVTVNLGFGKHKDEIPDGNLPQLNLLGVMSASFSIIASALSKTSFALTLVRVMDRPYQPVLWFIIATINLTGGLTALFSWIRCSPVEKVWLPLTRGVCWKPGIFTDFAIATGGSSIS